MRALAGRPITLTHQFLDADGDTIAASAVQVTVTDWTGATIATEAAGDDGSGVWSLTVPHQSLGVYTVTWDADDDTMVDTTRFEVVGGYLFTVPEARASDEYLADATAFPAAEIAGYRGTVAAEFERITGRSFVRRVKVVTFAADKGSPVLIGALTLDADTVVSALVNGVEVDSSGWRVDRLGKVVADTSFADGDIVTVAIGYGFYTVPDDIKRVAMIRVRSLMAAETSGIPDRATTWQPTEGGTFRLATPGKGGSSTGIPEVDACLDRYTPDAVLAVASIVI